MIFPSSGKGRWRRAVKADLSALSDFLKADELERVGFSGRLLRDEGGSPALHLPTPLRGSVWLFDAPGAASRAIAGAVLCHPSRLVFPIFPEGQDGDQGLALLASSFAPASVIGMAGDVARYESALRLEPRASVAYRLMTRPEAAFPTAAPRPEAAPTYPGLSLRRASLADLDSLLYLQEAYEREEVLTPIHEFNRAACRASLARALERQIIFAAEEDGTLVGKAGTNARGFGVDQVGGVYTLPERRGRGVARALMAALLAEIKSSGKEPALFVKPTNVPARALYRHLGFDDVGDYRADYFEA
jgi:GNAT superfamily N-acetyltransferase